MTSIKDQRDSAGFSLPELLISMVITLVIMGAASSLIASAFRVRARENQKSDALADVQRGLNIMSREIANAGCNLNNNGIVAADSNATTIRVRANLNRFDTAVSPAARSGIGVAGEDAGEDVKYFRNLAAGTEYLARYDEYSTNANKGTVLANRIDSMRIHYFDQRVTYTAAQENTDISNPSAAEVAPGAAKYIVIALSVTLNQVGTRGGPGFQPERHILLVSDVALRNSGLTNY